MSIILKQGAVTVTQPDGSVSSLDVVVDQSREQAIADIEAKKDEVLASIPDDYSQLSESIGEITEWDSILYLTQTEAYDYVTANANLQITPISKNKFIINGSCTGTVYIGVNGGITGAQVSKAHSVLPFTGEYYFEVINTSGITLRYGDIEGGATYVGITHKSTVNVTDKYFAIRVTAGTYNNAAFTFAMGRNGRISVKPKLQDLVEKDSKVINSLRMNKILHKTYTQFIAHKGSETRYPANSKIAYEMAGIEGWDILNIAKIRQSADGTWWVMHDETVDTTTDGTGAIANLTDSYLRTLKTTTHPSYAEYSIDDFTDEELRLLTFEDALKIANRYGMRVMVRGNFPSNYVEGLGKELWDSIIEILKKCGRYNSSTIISGIRQQCHVLRDLIKTPCEVNFYAQHMNANDAIASTTDGTIKDLSNLSIMLDNEYVDADSAGLCHAAGFKLIATSTDVRSNDDIKVLCEVGTDYIQDRTRHYI